MSLLQAGKAVADGIIRLLYPGVCWVCGEALPPEQSQICGSCRQALTDTSPTCPRCAGTVGPHVTLEDGCTSCRDTHFHFERAFRLGPYDGLFKEIILKLKHQAGEGLAEAMGALWGELAGPRLRALHADAVVPVPLHWWRRWRRGYNQIEALAGGIAEHLGLPCRRYLRRTRSTPLQTQQSPAARRTNVKNAFQPSTHLAPKNQVLILVDDVLTTGSTASEAARVLRQAGAAQVFVAVLARAQ